ncbi:hypothetical protein EMCRGX_G019552 [Ephydatia muelleri]
MLSNVGLDVVAKAAQKVSDNACNMLLQWLHLEDEGMIDEKDESEECTDADVSESPMDKAQLLSEVLPLLEKLHAYGARLSDCHILDAARKLCLHEQQPDRTPVYCIMSQGYQPMQNFPPQGGYIPPEKPQNVPMQGGYVPPQEVGYSQPGYAPSQGGYSASPQQGYYPQQGYVPPPQYTAGAQQQQSTTNVVVVQPAAVTSTTVIRPTGDHFLTLSIVMAVLCCVCGGWWTLAFTLPAIALASSAKTDDANGNTAAATQKGRIALGLNIAAVVVYLAILIIIIAVSATNAVSAVNSGLSYRYSYYCKFCYTSYLSTYYNYCTYSYAFSSSYYSYYTSYTYYTNYCY